MTIEGDKAMWMGKQRSVRGHHKTRKGVSHQKLERQGTDAPLEIIEGISPTDSLALA